MLKKLMKTKKGSARYADEYRLKEEVGVLEMCRKCYSFKYESGWHFERPESLQEHGPDEKISVKFSQCPACVEEALATYDMEYV